MYSWGKPKPTTSPTTEWGTTGWVQLDSENHTKVPVHPPILKPQTPLPLKIPLFPLKSPVHQKFVCSLIPSLLTSFTIFTRDISVLYITKKSRKSWRKSNSRIHLFVPWGLINSSMSHLTTLCIMKTSFMCERTDAYPFTHPFRPPMWNTNNQTRTHLSIIWPTATVLHHNFQHHAIPIFQQMTYLHTFSSPHMLSHFCPKFPAFQIPHVAFPPV